MGVNSFTVTNCAVWVGTGGTSGDKIDCLIIPATNYNTQSATASCHGTYTETGTSPSAFVNIPLSGCTIAGGSYWIGILTNDNAVQIGNFACPTIGCLNGATYQGNPNYASYYVASTYGTYTGLPTTYSNQSNLSISAYISGTTTCGTPPAVNVEDITAATTGVTLTLSNSAYASQSETLPFSAGDHIALVVTTAGVQCNYALNSLSAQIAEP